MALPRFLMLKSNANNKYLCHTDEKLGFTYDQSTDSKQDNNNSIIHSRLRFEVEKSKTVYGLVHIRSCYNKKYWVRKSMDSKYIAASGNEGEEDQSKWSCTLFKPIFLDSDSSSAEFNIRLLHISESGQRCHVLSSENHLAIGELGDESAASSFTAVDVEASVILPEFVTFMGPNDKYLSADGSSLVGSFMFSATDIAASGVAQHVKTQENITPIIDKRSNKYWCLSPLLLMLDLTDDLSKAALFQALKVDASYTALKCKDNNMFVCSLGDQGFMNQAAASATNITEMAMLRIGEPVRSRTISDATYDLDNSRVYNNNSLEMYSDSRSNYTDVEQEGSFEVDYRIEQSSTWTNSTTVNMGISVSWSAGIPYIGELGVDISYEHDQTWESGGEVTNGKEVKYTQGIKIPPGKKVTLKVLAQKASCDVPYTCTATDLMTDGTYREYTMTGLYTGSNEFKFDTEIIPEDL